MENVRYLLKTEDGNFYDLTAGNIIGEIISLDGVGHPSVKRHLERSPLLDGAVDKGYRLLPRRLELKVVIPDYDSTQGDSLRDNIAFLFSPTSKPLTLFVEESTGAESHRQIEVFLDGEVDFPVTPHIREGQQLVTIPLLAPDPLWKGQSPLVVTFPFGTTFHEHTFVADQDVWRQPFTVVFTGPVTDPFIANTTTGHQLRFDLVVDAGRTLTVNFLPGQRTAKYSEFSSSTVYGSVMGSVDFSASTEDVFSELKIYEPKWIQANTSEDGSQNVIRIGGNGGIAGTSTAVMTVYASYLTA